MKKTNQLALFAYVLLYIILYISCQSPASLNLTEADKQYIQNLTKNVQDNWNNGNRDPYLNRFTQDAIYMAPNMETLIGKDKIKDFTMSFPELRLQFTIMEIAGSAEYAYVRGAYALTTPQDSLVDKGKFLSIWKNVPEKNWLLSHDMFSSDLPLQK